ncbi:DUF998 domain-containing protein [Humibacter antri]
MSGAEGSRDRVLVIVTIALIVVYVLIDVALGILRPDYSIVSDFESDYGRGRFSWLMDVNFVVRGVLSALALIVLFRRRIARTWTAVLFGIWAVSSALLAFFPANVEGFPRVPSGLVHLVLAFGGFVAVAIATFVMSFAVVRRQAASQGSAVGLLVVASLGIVFLLALGGAAAWQASGMVERLFLLSQLVWIAWAVSAVNSRANAPQIS